MDFFLDWFVEIFSTIIVIILTPFAIANYKKILKWFSCNSRIRAATEAVSPSGKGLWLSSKTMPPKHYLNRMTSSIPILTIANLKGGVGKTTLAANLTASFAAKAVVEGKKPILAIDLDYQSSLSSMMLPDKQRLPTDDDISKAAKLISGTENGFWLTGAAMPVLNVDHAWCLPAYYDLASEENRLMINWLTGEQSSDIRYHLAEILLSPEVQARYSRIIIDAPPRLTTATIQALCTSTQVLIPTKLDVLSAEAVDSFISQLKKHEDLFPKLQMAGIAGTMNAHVTVPGQAITAITQALVRQGNPTHLLDQDTFVPYSNLIGLSAGEPTGRRIVYNRPSKAKAVRDIRDNFDRLRDAL